MNPEELKSLIAKAIAKQEWARANPDNPVCCICDLRWDPEDIEHVLLDGSNVCVDCTIIPENLP